MTGVWVVVLVVGALTFVFKAMGPVLLGGRELPARLDDVVGLLAPAILAALVVTQTVGGDRELVLDERLAGVAAATFALRLRAPILLAVALAAAVTAAVRAL